MPPSLFRGLGGEPGERLAFTQNRLDRRSEHRPETCLADALNDERTLAYACLPGQLVMAERQDGTAGLLPLSAWAAVSFDRANGVLLGYRPDGRALVTLPVADSPETLPPGFLARPLRAVYSQGLLPPMELGEMAQGASLVAWNLSCCFCGRCGAPTRSEAGGYRRVCSACAHTFFPRTDPVVIMLAIDEKGDRCLLGRSPHFPSGMYSCLAGFLEPGETMEQAVRRETFEEAGIAVGAVRYHACQPWPMPHTLMVGFYAQATSFTIDADTLELEDCRWFTRAEAAGMLDAAPGGLTTANKGAIANLLLRDWVENRVATEG
jgi:NAD+ diphosphatase